MRTNNGFSNGFKLAAMYTCVILGAGFASGQELLQYFVAYGPSGIWGLITAGVLFAVTGWATLDICHRKGFTDYRELMIYLAGKRLGLVLEALAALFLFVLFVAMLSAGGAMLEQSSNFSFTVGVLLIAVIVLVALWFGLEGIALINGILAPVMVVGGIFMGLYAFFNRTSPTFLQDSLAPKWILSAIVYASYNIVSGMSVLASSSRLAKSHKDCMMGGLMGGFALTFLGICMALPLYLNYAEVISVEIPFLVVAEGFGQIFTFLYLALMMCAIFTTAISNSFALTEVVQGYIKRYSKNDITSKSGAANHKENRRMLCMILVALGIPAAYIGFSNIVGYVYPLFGFLGVFQIVIVILSWRKLCQSQS
ncbi:MAG: hypothetical protein FWC91_03565 [Defluviitaleaceae bacterium]|nr:hypothetical protein [Defluviitaleaceae bacterium]